MNVNQTAFIALSLSMLFVDWSFINHWFGIAVNIDIENLRKILDDIRKMGPIITEGGTFVLSQAQINNNCNSIEDIIE